MSMDRLRGFVEKVEPSDVPETADLDLLFAACWGEVGLRGQSETKC